jgi:flavin-binding protein dodecin
MSRPMMRRIASVVAATALIAGGLAVGAGTAAAAQAPYSATKTTSNIKVTKSVVGDGTVAPGQKVTYRTTIATTAHPDRFISRVTDFHPAGFKYVNGSAKLTAWHLVGGVKTENVTPEVDVNNNTVSVPSAGMAISQTDSKTVTFEVTYLVPENAQIGTAPDSGVSFDVSGFATTQTFNPMGVSATIRALNPGEAAATGSSELGLGSSDGEGGTTGSAGSAIVENPTGFVVDVLRGVIGS